MMSTSENLKLKLATSSQKKAKPIAAKFYVTATLIKLDYIKFGQSLDAPHFAEPLFLMVNHT